MPFSGAPSTLDLEKAGIFLDPLPHPLKTSLKLFIIHQQWKYHVCLKVLTQTGNNAGSISVSTFNHVRLKVLTQKSVSIFNHSKVGWQIIA